MRTAAAFVVLVAVAGNLALITGTDRRSTPTSPRNGHVQQFWADGTIKSDVTYANDAYDGDYHTWYASGHPYELRHYVNGHEEGTQQSWTEDGVLYLNYEVHDGRRYGLVNASPCNVVADVAAEQDTGRPSPAHRATRVSVQAQRWPDDQMTNWPDSSALPYYDSPDFTPHWTSVAHRVTSFTLPTQSGTPISAESLRGHPYVASFIYTQCAAICPIVVSQLSRVQAAVAHTGARILSFSVTPETDTPAALAAFGRERGIDPHTWSLVTGSRRTIYALARSSFFADDTRVGSAPDDETAFLHTEKLLLVDGSGQLRGVYNGTQPHAVDQLIGDILNLTTGRSHD